MVKEDIVIIGKEKIQKVMIETFRKKPCVMCGSVDKEGNHIIGYDHTDVDEILSRYYKLGDTLCEDCLFK